MNFSEISSKQAQQIAANRHGALKVAEQEADTSRRFGRPNKNRPYDEKHNAGEPLITCHGADCVTRFLFVAERQARAPYCLDCAEVIFGTRSMTG